MHRSASPTSIITTQQRSSELQTLPLIGTDPAVFEAGLEYLYTGSKGAEVFAVLFDGFDEGIRDGEEELKGIDKLRQDLLYMWRSKLYADLSLSLNDSVGSDFVTHRAILASRAPYFKSLLLGEYSDSNQHQFTLPSPPFTSASTHFVLGYIYAGCLDFSNRSFDLTTAFEIYRGAAYLSIALLQAEIETKIEQMVTLARAARIYAFALAPDVNSQRLARAVTPLVIANFGDVWGCPQIGNLEYEAQRKLVASLCSKITPETVALEGKKSFLLRKRIELEKANWAVHVRSMLDAVDERVKTQVGKSLAAIVVSSSFVDLVNGIGFSTDVLEWLLELVVETLTEATAPEAYEALVGSVLLREEGILMDAKVLVEDAKNGVLKYIRRKWVGVRAARGFEKLEPWCQKELSDELEIPMEELLATGKASMATPRSTPRPSQKSAATTDTTRMTPAQRVQSNAAESAAPPTRTPRSSTASVASERSQLNGARPLATSTPRTAAPSVNGRVNSTPVPPTAPVRAPIPSASNTTATISRMTRAPVSTTQPSSSMPPPARTRVPPVQVSASAAPRPTPTTARRPPSLAPSVASTRTAASTSISTARPLKAGTAPSPVPSPKTPLTPASSKTEPLKAPTVKGKEVATPRSAFKRPSSVASGKTAVSSSSAHRPNSVASVRAANAPVLKRPKSATSLKTPRAATATTKATQQASPDTRTPTRIRRPSLPKSSPSAVTPSGLPAPPPPLPSSPTPVPGTTLLSGIPCIVTVTSDRPSRFRAVVRYIGAMLQAEGQWIGIEVAESAIPDDAQELEWNDGSVGGAQYFKINPPEPMTLSGRATPVPVEGIDGRSAGGSSSSSSLRPPSRRGRRSSSTDQDNSPRRGLFVRPHQIVYIL